ncbi:MAG: radical SAM protein [Planctomycetes bacterium]|jgi:MoaA/NifB/PqqE/SkfB family radical SAM enzyme|nr:radical SAM protein [Planctomycetota bacterium]
MKDMDDNSATLILNEFASNGGEKVDLTGGEPFLHAGIMNIIAAARNQGLKTKVVTNGSLGTWARLNGLKTAGLAGLSVSLDGANYLTYSQIRPVDEETYSHVKQTIRNSLALGLFTKINTVVFSTNLPEMEQITKKAIVLGVNELRFCYFSPLGRGKISQALVANPEKWLVFIRRQLSKYATRLKIVLEVPIIEADSPLATGCLARQPNFLHIFPNGDAFPCSIMAERRQPLFNLNKVSLSDFIVWREKLGEEYYRENIAPLFALRGGCVNYSFNRLLGCRGFKFVCPARKFGIEEVMR